MRAGVFVLLIIISPVVNSQNLVLNPGFEDFFKCPGSYNYSTEGKVAPGWFSPSMGTPDIFNKCSTGDAGVPENWAGRSTPYSGAGYAGIYAYIHDKPKAYREYLQAELKEPLEAGGTYLIEFYFKLSSNSKYSIDRIGFFISDSANRFNNDDVFPKKATYERINQSVYNRTTGMWTRLGFSYIAKGGEKYLTIGNFSSDKETRFYFIYNSQATEPMLSRGAYYFIDDVKVIQTIAPPNIPAKAPSLTGYSEIKVNQDYVLKNIQFAFDDFALLEASYPELEKLISILRYNKNWKVIITGHTDDVGSEQYNLDLSIKRASSVTEFILDRGVDPARVRTLGIGKSKPLVKTTDENSRAINRRVEIRFTN